jgi:integrative and conjugative element protein (TIGR02256 family)
MRWPLGIAVAGLPKTEVIKNFIAEHYPHTRVMACDYRIGAVRENGVSDLTVLDKLLEGVDLVYDSTAEVGVQHLLSNLAREREIPYVCVSATEGGWGGLIARLRPQQTAGCWLCLQQRLVDGSIPTPPANPKGTFQPLGCANPTFTGSGFDIAQVSLAGVRLAVSTLVASEASGYPGSDCDVIVLSFRTPVVPMRKQIGTAWISDRTVFKIVAEAGRAFPKETGGVLMGYWAVSFTEVVITNVIGPGPKAMHNRHSFLPDPIYQQGEVARIYERSGRLHTYLGDWHTHPHGASRLSLRDKWTLHTIVTHDPARVEVPLMALLSGSPKKWTVGIWRCAPIRFRSIVLGFRTTCLHQRSFK